MKAQLIIPFLLLMTILGFGQNPNKNAVTFNVSGGNACRQTINNEQNFDSLFNYKPNFYYSFDVQYSRLFSEFEFSFLINTSASGYSSRPIQELYSDNGKTSIATVERENTYYSIQMAPGMSYCWLNQSRYKLFSSFSVGINHVFRDVFHDKLDFDSLLTDRDTTYVNKLDDFRPINFSARIATGGMVQLSENFYLKSELYYESKLYSIFKDSPSDNNKAWTRFYNYGVNVGLRYCF